MLSDEDREWLKRLNVEIWPQKDPRTSGEKLLDRMYPGKNPAPTHKAREKLTRDEIDVIFRLIEEAPLVTTLFAYGMFGGVGLSLYAHEDYPGTGADLLLHISEDHLPALTDRSVYEHILGVPPRPREERKPGAPLKLAWDIFSKFTHSAKNRAWLERYGIQMHFDEVYYHY